MWWQNNAPDQFILSIGAVSVHWYGLLFLVGFIVAIYIAWKTKHYFPVISTKLFSHASNFFTALENTAWILFVGILGARLWEVFVVSADYYFANPIKILSIWEGGLAIQGGIIAVLAVLFWKLKKDTLEVFDWLSLSLAIGHAVGRWGNYTNQELFGLPTQSWYGVFISPEKRPEIFVSFNTFIPVSILESLALILIGIILYFLIRNKFGATGIVFGAYLLLTGIVRFSLDYLQWYSATSLYNLRLTQWFALIFVLVGVYLLVRGILLLQKRKYT